MVRTDVCCSICRFSMAGRGRYSPPGGWKELRRLFCSSELVVLPKPDPKGYRIVLGRLRNHDPAKYSFTACVKVLQLVMETHSREQGTAPGFIFVYDMKGVTVAHLGRTSLSAVRQYLIYVQVTYYCKDNLPR